MFFSKRPAAEKWGGLIAGLGNPGPKYSGTRHNMGFEAVEDLLYLLDGGREKPEKLSQGKKFDCLLWKCTLPDNRQPWLAAMPMTFMNLSGQAIQPLMAWYKIAPANLLVVHDELDLPPGVIMLKTGGGLAGHNGLKSIAERLGTNEFHRLRIGIGRPDNREQLLPWVLGRPCPADEEKIKTIMPTAVQAILLFASEGPGKTANKINALKKAN